MGFDRILKRAFPVMVCALLGAAAFFQANGLGQLIAAALGSTAPASPAHTPRARLQPPKRKSALPILARNAFDSETGPLDGSSTKIPELKPNSETAPENETAGERSEKAPKCDFGRVVMISASDDPAWSFAAISDNQGKTKLRRLGDEVAGHKLLDVGWNRVWLDNSGAECQMLLGDRSSTTATVGPKKSARRRRRKRKRGRGISAEMASKIHKVSETEYNVERSVVNEILQNQAQLMRSARIAPERRGGKIVGIRLFGIRSESLLHTLGIRSGDRLESINGFEMTDPQKALEAYGRLQTASNLKVRVNRKGKPTTIEFNIQ